MDLKKLFFNVLKILVSGGLLYYIIHKVGWSNIIDSLKGLSAWWLLIPALLFSILNLAAGAYNYYRLVKLKDSDFKFWLLLKYYLYMWGISLFLPSRIGEFSMIYFLKSKNIDYGEATAMFVLEKLIVLIVVTFCALIGVFVLLPFWTAVEISALVCCLGLLTLFLLLSDKAWVLLNKILKGRLDKFKS